VKSILIVLGILLGLFLIGWLGFQITPQGYPATGDTGAQMDLIPVPEGLPQPVENFYHEVYGGEMPVVSSAVISGRGTMRIKGLTMPVRWRFTYRAGKDYRHQIQTTWFGLPLLKVNEVYQGGAGRLELPFGISEGPKVNQGANLGLWAEAIWMPSLWLTDPAVSWEALDEHTAVLAVPFGEKHQRFVVRFDPETGMIHMMESMRFKGEESESKTLWLNQVRQWGKKDRNLIPVEVALTWFDEGTPWAILSVDSIAYNIDVEEAFTVRKQRAAGAWKITSEE